MTNAHVETLRSNGYELKQNTVVNPGFYWVKSGDRDDAPKTFDTPAEAACHYCELYGIDLQKIPHSIVINWDDGDITEQGTYAWAGLALDAGDAEIEARTAMFDSYAENMGWSDEDREEKLESLGDIVNFGGSVVESYPGANIWAAPDALKALNAIRARVHGEWDHPDLMAIGPLGSISGDILRIVEPVIAKLEGRSA